MITLLLIGTPVQNNIDELYSLLNFMQPSDFPDKSSFIEKYGNFIQCNTSTVILT